jgi:hypothetical protein
MGVDIIDKYSLLHFATGIIAYFWGIKFNNWFIIHLIFELIENSKLGIALINRLPMWPGGKEYPDTIYNMIGDQTFGMLGWYLAYLIR